MTISIKILWFFTGLYVIVSFSIMMIYSLGFDLNNPEVLERKFNKLYNKYPDLINLMRDLEKAEKEKGKHRERFAFSKVL